MMIDFSKRRPVKLPDFLDSIENKEKGRALDDPFDRLPVLKTVENERKFIVRYSDLDVNNHVNSGHYITWALEALPVAIREKYQVKDIQINYRAEAVYGDRVLSQIEAFRKKDGFEVLHRLLREKDGKELCRAVSQWAALQS
jgi:medium-chain acyl-[acyl-carrier-protein] hydrolase